MQNISNGGYAYRAAKKSLAAALTKELENLQLEKGEHIPQINEEIAKVYPDIFTLWRDLFKIASLIGFAWVFRQKILKNKKLTTEPGHYGEIYLAFFVCGCVYAMAEPIEILTNLQHFGNGLSEVKRLLITGILNATAFSFLSTWYFAIPEDYEGCCACFKCLKPWRVEQALPVYMHSSMHPNPVYMQPPSQQKN